MPVVFSKAFYKLLADLATEFRTTRTRFVIKALHYYAEMLRKKNSPMIEALPSEDVVEAYRNAQSKLAKKWWASLPPEEKAARTKRANDARWPKKPAKKKSR